MTRALVIAILLLTASRAHALAVELSPDVTADWGPTIVAAHGSQFPAISADGTTIVELYADEQDFVGTPIATAVFYTKTDTQSFQWASDKDDRHGAELVVKAINARLAKTKWRALAELPADIRVTFDDHKQVVTVSRAGKKTTASFPAPGDIMDRDLGSGGCGGVVSLDKIYGDAKAGFVVVEPRVGLGGDSCMGRPIADIAITVRVP
ncbi:MAG TPA: hypothetical protein VL463_33865 [Kofleriaceae bacterium]|nr:hypothetical protein [Kofleriaceae bacterium]